jgi:hypothetical protein
MGDASMSRQPFSDDWRANRQKNMGKAIGMTCLTLFAIPFVFFFFAVFLAIVFGDSEEATYNGQPVQKVSQQQTLKMVATPASQGLDLEAVLAAFKEAPNAEEFEKTLNDSASGLNNLDLNADGKVDFIKVTEYGNGKDVFGFALTTEPEAGQEQEIAKIELFKEGEQVQAQVLGNQQIYGPNYGFMTAMNIAQIAMLAYLISDMHRPYRSSYRYGYYPSYYRPYNYVPYNSYRSRTDRYRTTSSLSRLSQPRNLPTGIRNPMSGKTATSGIARTLRAPTAGQTSFQSKFRSNMQSQPRSSSRSGGSARGSSGRSWGSGK